MSTIKPIGSKLKQILSERGITATELSRMADVRTSFIYDVLSGKSKNPSIITLSKIANSLAIPLSDLSGNETKGISGAAGSKISPHYAAIPKLNIGAHEDSGTIESHAFADIDHYMFSHHWIKNNLNTSAEYLRLHTITGDSMAPTLGHGDVILVDTSNTNPSPPGIFVLFDGYGLVVKRVEMLPGEITPLLSIKSDNKQYSDYTKSLNEARIIGRVVWFAREL